MTVRVMLLELDPEKGLWDLGQTVKDLGTIKSLHLSSECVQALQRHEWFVRLLHPNTDSETINMGLIGMYYGCPVTTDAFDSPVSMREHLPGLNFLLYYTPKEQVA